MKQIGKFGVYEIGLSYDCYNNSYKTVEIVKFNKQDKQVGAKYYYFRWNSPLKEGNQEYVLPEFKTEHEVEDFYNRYKDRSVFECRKVINIIKIS